MCFYFLGICGLKHPRIGVFGSIKLSTFIYIECVFLNNWQMPFEDTLLFFDFTGASGPITAAHSGQIPSHLPSLSAGSSGSQPSILTVHPSWGQTLPKYEPCGVSSKQTRTHRIPINESLLTILLKLHTKLAGKSKPYVPPSVSAQPSSGDNDSSGAYYVQRVLNKLCQQNAECARTVEDCYNNQQSKEGASAKKGKPVDNETR